MLILPDEPKALARTLRQLIYQSDAIRRTKMPEWTINYAFLNGVRDFTSIDYLTGHVQFKYTNEYGKFRFKNEEVLRNLQIEMGRFLGIDVRPSVEMLGWGLDRLRAAGIAQVILDHEITDRLLARARIPFIENLLIYGCAGIAGWVQNAGALSGRQMLENIPPWELFFIPGSARNPMSKHGLVRSRMLPIRFIRDHPQIGPKLRGKTDEELEVRELPWGEWEQATGEGISNSPVGNVLGLFANAVRTSMDAAYDGDGRTAGKHLEGRQVARVSECWLTTPDDLVTRYMLMVGKEIPIDVDFEKKGETVYMPIGIGRYYPVGAYGRPYLSPIIPFVSEMEKSYEAIFAALRELDAMGIMGIPTGLGLSEQEFTISGNPRRFFFSPDPFDRSGTMQPIHIPPRPLGTFPAQGLQVGVAAIDRLSGQGPLLSGQAAGRADSAAAFGFLLETSNVGIEAPGNSMSNAFVQVYSSILNSAKYRMTKQDLNRVINLDQIPVGVSVTDDGFFDLTKNPIPTPDEVKINVKSRTPPSPQQQIQELKEQLQLQVIDHRQYRIEIYKRGLKVPVSNEGEYQSWRKIRMNIRHLFNDGVTPNIDRIAFNPDVDEIDVHLEEIMAFMKSPEYSMAKIAVKEAFDDWLELYKNALPGMGDRTLTPDELETAVPAGANGDGRF